MGKGAVGRLNIINLDLGILNLRCLLDMFPGFWMWAWHSEDEPVGIN